jgi:diadenosine tetraphosphate (Ap4A) HIT family hydrolase
MIKLHPQLEKDCTVLGEFTLCTLLLVNDANYPWFILLPNRENITEIHQLSASDQQQLLSESMFFCHCLEDIYQPDKLNIAALGNVVPQLHIHHIARFTLQLMPAGQRRYGAQSRHPLSLKKKQIPL